MYICEKCMKEMVIEKTVSIDNFQGTQETLSGYVLYCKDCGLKIINGWTILGKVMIESFPEMLERRKRNE